MSLSTSFIHRPVGTTLLMVAITLAGGLGYQLLPVAQLPQVDFPTIQAGASLSGGGSFVALNAAKYQGPLSVEWEDSGMDREHGARESCQYVKNIDFATSARAFDAAFAD